MTRPSVVAARARGIAAPGAPRVKGCPWPRLFATAIVALAIARQATAAEEAIPGVSALGTGGGQVTVDAASITYDRQANVITATGQVQVTRGDMVLTADLVRVNRTTQVAEAEGNVVLTDPEGKVVADSLVLNLVEETGSLANGEIFLEKNRYQLSGRRFEKFPGQSYRVEAGSFTTCQCGPGRAPDWSVRGERVTLDLDGYARVESGRFEVRGVPVFYVPYGIFPVKRERQTGFLFPRFGVSNRRGFQIEQPFYVAINKSMDATLSIDIETAARVGVLGEYRYALSRDTLGELHASYFNEQIRGASSDEVVNSRIADPDIPVDRWSVGLTHDQWLPTGFRGYADVFRVSDDLFLREINVFTFNPGVDVALRTRRFERSRVGAERLFDRGMVSATATWYQDFINPDEFTFHTPPRIEALAGGHLWRDRMLVRLAAEAVNFERDQGFEGQRLDIHPEIEVPWRLSKYAYGSFRGGLRESVYRLDETSVPLQVNTNPADPGSKPPSILPALEKDATRELYHLGGEVGTSVARVFPLQRWGITALKHTLEPSVSYLFVPRSDTRQAALPLFDDVDRVNRRSVFTYGVTSRLLARMAEPAGRENGSSSEKERKGSELLGAPATGTEGPIPTGARRGPIRELGRFSFFQSYDIANKGGDFIDEVDPDTGEVLRDEGDRASDLALYLRLTPAAFLSFEGRTDYSVTSARPKGAALLLSVADPRTPRDDFTLASLRGRSRVGIGYRFVADRSIEEINGSLLFRLTKRWYFAYEARYDNLSKRLLENRYGVRLISDCECWVVDLGVSDRVNPDETEVRVLVTLVGLGQFGKEPFRGSFGAAALPTGGGP